MFYCRKVRSGFINKAHNLTKHWEAVFMTFSICETLLIVLQLNSPFSRLHYLYAVLRSGAYKADATSLIYIYLKNNDILFFV